MKILLDIQCIQDGCLGTFTVLRSYLGRVFSDSELYVLFNTEKKFDIKIISSVCPGELKRENIRRYSPLSLPTNELVEKANLALYLDAIWQTSPDFIITGEVYYRQIRTVINEYCEVGCLKIAEDCNFYIVPFAALDLNALGRKTKSAEDVSKIWVCNDSSLNIKKKLSEIVRGQRAIYNINDICLTLSSCFNSDNDRKLAAQSVVNQKKYAVYYDVTSIINQQHMSGIKRVSDQLMKYLPDFIPENYQIINIAYIQGEYRRISYLNNKLRVGQVINPVYGDIYLSVALNAETQLKTRDLLMTWKFKGVSLIAVVYDLVFVKFPQFVAPGGVKALVPWLDFVCCTFDLILTDSHSVKKELISYLDTKFSSIVKPHVEYFHLGVDENRVCKKALLSSDLISLKNAGSTVFCAVSTVEPRKGYVELVKAFEQLLSKVDNCLLLIVGRDGWKSKVIKETITSSRYYGKKIFWFNNASDDHLSQIYKFSDVYISASYYEGFGLGVVEAIKFEKALLLRELPVYREICGDLAVYFNSDDLCDKLKYCHDHIDALRNAPLPLVLSWRQSSEMLWRLIEKSALLVKKL